MEYNYLFKIVIVGDSGVGKTSLLSKFIDKSFTENHFTTICPNFKNTIINLKNEPIKLQIWDMPGIESFRDKIKSYYKGAHGIILMYDSTDKNSFKNIRNWIEQIEEYVETNVFKVLVANKCDKFEDLDVNEEDGKKLADEFDMKFFETSAKNTENVDEVFNSLTTDILNDKENE